MVIGPVKPGVDERRRRPQNTGEAAATHHTVRHPVLLEQRERAVLQPGRAPSIARQLMGNPHLAEQPSIFEGRVMQAVVTPRGTAMPGGIHFHFE